MLAFSVPPGYDGFAAGASEVDPFHRDHLPGRRGEGIGGGPRREEGELQIGLDIAKYVFQVHGADGAGHVLFRKRITRVVDELRKIAGISTNMADYMKSTTAAIHTSIFRLFS